MTTVTRTGPKVTPELEYRSSDDGYGKVMKVSIPAGKHQVKDITEMDVDLDSQLRVADLLHRIGAPPGATDFMYGWTGADLAEDGTLTIYFRP